MQSQGKLVLIIGPSGVGKSAIMKYLKEHHAEAHFPRSATTRAKRTVEADDAYHFVSEAEFDHLLDTGDVLEYAVVHGKARYATLISEIIPYIDNGKVVIRDVDVQGFDSIRHHKLFRKEEGSHVLQSIFVLPESKQQLIDQINERAPMSAEEITRRMASMEHELKYAGECDVQIVNKSGQLDDTITQVTTAIFAQ